MLTLIFFINYLGIISICCFYVMPNMYIANYNTGLKKNPALIKENPEILKKFPKRNLPTKISYLFGVVLILLLIYAAFREQSLFALTKVLVLSVMVISASTLIEMLYGLRLYRAIPSPENRSAELIPRGPQDYVHFSMIYVGYFFIFIVLGIYIYGYMTESIPIEVAIRRMTAIAGIILLSAIVYLAMFYRPIYIDKLVGETSRKAESYLFVFVLYLSVLVGFWRIANDFFQVLLNLDIWFFFTMSILLQVLLIYSSRIKEMQLLIKEKPEDILGIPQ